MSAVTEALEAPAAAVDAATEVTVKSIKGFDSNLACRGYQFAIGETYVHSGEVEACRSGFHACDGEQHPLSVFEFYPPAGSRYCDVTQGGALDRQKGCSKIASATITIDVEITIGELVKRAWDFVWSRATKSDEAHVTVAQGAASATGTRGAASATGTRGAASATGDQGAASATGYQGAASATGTRGAASATGTRGAASATGYQGAAMSSGWRGTVSGEPGNALFAVELDDAGKIVSVAAGVVGVGGIKAGVWYRAEAGRLIEAA